MASSSKAPQDKASAVGSFPNGVIAKSLPEQYVYNEIIGANRYETLMLERCFKNKDGECEIIRLIGLWDKCENQWVQGYPCAVDIRGQEWCGDLSELKPVFGNKPNCRGPIPGPPGIQGLQGAIGPIGLQGDIGIAGPPGPEGPESSCTSAESESDCPYFAFDQTESCSPGFLIARFFRHDEIGMPSPNLKSVSGANFDPSAVPASLTSVEENLVDYTNNTECCQEIQCAVQSGNEVLLSTDRGSELTMAVWIENQSGQYIPQSFHKFTHEPQFGGSSSISSKTYPLVSTPWTVKLNPGENVKYTLKFGLLDYFKLNELASSDALFTGKVDKPCIECRVTTVGDAQ